MNSRNTSRFHLGALCVPPDRAGVLEYPLPSEEREGADLLQAIAELKRLPTTECCQWKQIPVFTTPDPMTQSLSADGKCIYCAYDLSGIPPGARCPECGRESLPLAIRQEVHAIFDSPRRLCREALRVLTRHPPGWYWSLDRETDVRRSFAFAMINVVLCFAIAFGAWFLADSVRIESTTERRLVDRSGSGAPITTRRLTGITGALGHPISYRLDEAPGYASVYRIPAGRVTSESVTHRVLWQPSLNSDPSGLLIPGWLLCIWLMLTHVGFCTQIRRGLPKFARARRTILSAANAESCRLPILAAIVGLILILEGVARCVLCEAAPSAITSVRTLLIALIMGSVWVFWIGPLRSDPFRLVIRSRFHAARMFCLYVVVLPVVVVTVLADAINLLLLS